MDNNADNKICFVCFVEFEENDKQYTCANPECDQLICGECIELLINYSSESNILPQCPNTNCQSLYIISCLSGLDAELIREYAYTCLNYFVKENGSDIKKKLEENNMVDRIRTERLKFIEQNFPKGISFVAKLAFKDKMKQLDKQKRMILDMKLKKADKPCINVVCNGFLDPDYVCMSCNTEFCKKCEKKMVKPHECKQEDIESLNLIGNLIKCPGCKLPVFKNEGCDSITCSNCQTRFLYSTGKIGGHGSVNAKINVDIKKKNLLSIEYRNKLNSDCLELILKFESLVPPFKSKDTLLTPIKMYVRSPTEKNKIKYSKDLAKKINDYTIWKYRNDKYNKYTVEIGNILASNSDTLHDKLSEIINELS